MGAPLREENTEWTSTIKRICFGEKFIANLLRSLGFSSGRPESPKQVPPGGLDPQICVNWRSRRNRRQKTDEEAVWRRVQQTGPEKAENIWKVEKRRRRQSKAQIRLLRRKKCQMPSRCAALRHLITSAQRNFFLKRKTVERDSRPSWWLTFGRKTLAPNYTAVNDRQRLVSWFTWNKKTPSVHLFPH